MSVICRVWRGEYALPQQFWLAHLLPCVGYLLLVRLLMVALAPTYGLLLANVWTPLLVAGGLFGLMAWSLTGLWRAAGRHELWPRMLARSWVLVASGVAYAIFVAPWLIVLFA